MEFKMNNLKNLFLICFLLYLFAIANVEALPTCPPGSVIQTYSLVVGCCRYDVELCIMCPPANSTNPAYSINILSITKNPACVECVGMDTIYQKIWDQVLDVRFIINNIITHCQFAGVVPCPGYGTNFTTYKQVCWYKMNMGGNIIKYFPCDPGTECREGWILCYDNNLQKYTLSPDGNTPSLNPQGTPSCNGNIGNNWPDPPLPKGTTTPCFYLKTLCFP
jgi:hypothetical protein